MQCFWLFKNSPHKYSGACEWLVLSKHGPEVRSKTRRCVCCFLFVCVCVYEREIVYPTYCMFPSTVKFDCLTRPKARCPPILCILTQRIPQSFPDKQGSLCPSCLDGEDVHGAGARQGTDGHLLRQMKGCIISITFFPSSTFPELPACFWQMLALMSSS